MSSVYRHLLTPSVTSGGWGVGVFSSSVDRFQFQWPHVWAPVHITVKEALYLSSWMCNLGQAVAGWYNLLQDRYRATVAMTNKGTSRNSPAIHLLLFFQARFNLFLQAKHVQGENNVVANSLSRKNLPMFFHHTNCHPTPIPSELTHPLCSTNQIGHWQRMV